MSLQDIRKASQSKLEKSEKNVICMKILECSVVGHYHSHTGKCNIQGTTGLKKKNKFKKGMSAKAAVSPGDSGSTAEVSSRVVPTNTSGHKWTQEVQQQH